MFCPVTGASCNSIWCLGEGCSRNTKLLDRLADVYAPRRNSAPSHVMMVVGQPFGETMAGAFRIRDKDIDDATRCINTPGLCDGPTLGFACMLCDAGARHPDCGGLDDASSLQILTGPDDHDI